MDDGGQRLLDVINDPSALESFLGLHPPPTSTSCTTTATASTVTPSTSSTVAAVVAESAVNINTATMLQ
ncbi:hypothetical protein B566_EDAN001187, partial [Ephemera danica]